VTISEERRVREQEAAGIIAANMRRHRKLADMSQEELALLSENHLTEISMLERGHRVPRVTTLLKIASSLEVSMDELTKGISWSPGHYSPGSYAIKQGEK
jgi:transcriptional regulator with XRE-family HTH domain